jgi:uncharacterized iron-regulated membrane protein
MAARRAGSPREPLGREAALARGRQEAAAHGIHAPAGAMFYTALGGMYAVGFFEPGHDHADGSLGNPWVYLDAHSGKLVQLLQPGTGSTGDQFLALQFPLHSGRLFGVPGRILISVLGVTIAMLSVTGVILWARRQRRSAPKPRSIALENESHSQVKGIST